SGGARGKRRRPQRRIVAKRANGNAGAKVGRGIDLTPFNTPTAFVIVTPPRPRLAGRRNGHQMMEPTPAPHAFSFDNSTVLVPETLLCAFATDPRRCASPHPAQ